MEINRHLRSQLQQLETTLNAVQHGVLLVDRRGTVRICNSSAFSLLGLPGELAGRPFAFTEVSCALEKLHSVEGAEGTTALLSRNSGQTIEIHAHRMADGGAVILVEDVTEDRKREHLLQQAEAEYRSLFENSVYGIYRDTLDGKPVRANPALAKLNGYETEEEHIEAVSRLPFSWYVEPGRSREFYQLLESRGRVTDLVSEVYSHRTRQRVWITENAWYVRDANGVPIFVEGTIQDATERVQAMREIERLANCDHLTGTANRFRFLKTLEELTAAGDCRCLLFCIDLDRFKEVNDTLGHHAGDTVLITVAARLAEIAGSSGTVARLGGDEFAILLPCDSERCQAADVAGRIVRAMEEPITIDGQDLTVGASVGVAAYPDHASGGSELLANADLALYRAKSAGRNGYYVFDYSLKQDISNRRNIEADLRGASERDELELHYQPIVAAADGTVTALESLIRWRHPRRGLLLPASFIPVAEESGLAAALGVWSLERACMEARAFPPNLHVSVNVSPVHLRSGRLVEHVEAALHKSGLPAHRLELELTETAIHASQSVAEIFSGLRRLGVRLALDDFGTGYSSLSYLQRFAFHTVKIDRSFIAGMTQERANLAIIKAVLAIGRDIGTAIVAEGVETELQRDRLLSEGCLLMQGFLFGHPRTFSDTINDLALQALPERQHGEPPLPPAAQSSG